MVISHSGGEPPQFEWIESGDVWSSSEEEYIWVGANLLTTGNATILLADDDPVMLKIVSRNLEKLGYRVLTADSGERSLEVARENPPDLAILDVRMPGIDGVETAKQLRSLRIESMFLTAYHDLETVNRAMAQGAIGYLVKPVAEPQLEKAVSEALELARKTREAAEAGLQTRGVDPEERYRIGIAIGMLMGIHKITEEQASDLLIEIAQRKQVEIGQAARDLAAGDDSR